MTHIGIRYFPFALAMLPFLAVGIGTPVTIQDWSRGRLLPADGKSMLVGLVAIVVWELAILYSLKWKERRGQERLLGRELDSWYWAPPITFVVGVVSGVIFLCT